MKRVCHKKSFPILMKYYEPSNLTVFALVSGEI